ncbi:MAG TPA: hypothetical protein VGM90_20115 [Kofleriaceae bacterium]|jgi:hypothetical protein
MDRTVKLLFAAALFTPALALAQEAPIPLPTPPVEEKLPEIVPPEEPPAPQKSEADERFEKLEKRIEKLEDELDQNKDDQSYLEQKINQLMPLTSRITGYIDMGAFVTNGNGAGTRSDFTNSYLPQYAGKVPGSWVFMGDPLSTTVNSRGDVADTGDSRAITFDPINSKGKSTALINNVNLTLFTGVGETGSALVSVDLVPRARDIGDVAGLFVGDYIDVKLAYGEWKPKLDKIDLALQAGKFDSVVGREYRQLESPDRIGVTPSLICRYLCGRPVGVKARAKYDKVTANVAVTNGSNFTEGFSFSDETDSNNMKTFAGRLSYGTDAIELGASGAFGAQDFQPDNDVYQWHYGADFHLDMHDFEFTAEYVHGRAKGKTSEMSGAMGVPCDLAPCLTYKGAYGQASYRVSNVFTPYVRVDWRDALHQSGASFVYYSELMRVTAGVRAEIGTRVILKAEATKNIELGELPQFPDDVITSSLVLKI